MVYDRDSFLAGVAVGRNMKSWPEMKGYGKGFFAFTIKTVAASFTYQFGIYFGGTIDWGDGTSEDYAYNNFRDRISHVYTDAGIYQIRITGYVFDVLLGTTNGTTPRTPSASAARLISVDTPFPMLQSPYSQATTVNLNYCFASCSNLTKIPNNLLANYKSQGLVVTGIANMFASCQKIKKIPKGLFGGLVFSDNLADSSNPKYLFSNCRSLEELPEDIFSNEVFKRITTAEGMFTYCTKLQRLPVDELPFQSVEDIDRLFFYCESLHEVHPDAFKQCQNIRTIDRIFAYSGLRVVPAGLFKNKTRLVAAEMSFMGADELETISEEVFTGCTVMTSAYACFEACNSLVSIPSDLFNGCTALASVRECFLRCYALGSVPSSLFLHTPNITNFASCFYDCRNITSAVPELWLSFPNANGNDCYWNCTDASNYEDIPSAWR